MNRLVSITLVLAATTVGSTACTVEGASYSRGNDSQIQVTGVGTVAKLTYVLPGDKKPTTLTHVRLPWTKAARGTGAGSAKVTLTPSRRGVGCEIVLNMKTVVTRQGAPNTELTCAAVVKG